MYIFLIVTNFAYLNCMLNPNPITQHGLKMFCILLFCCELKLKLKTLKQCRPTMNVPLHIKYIHISVKRKEGNNSLHFKTLGVISLCALEVSKCCTEH